MYGRMKMYEEMRREYATWVRLRKESYPLAEKVVRAQMAYLEDDKETLRELLPELEAHVGEEKGIGALLPSTNPMIQLAMYYFCLGENDKGFDRLGCSYSRREQDLPWITLYPDFDSVRTDPRYLDLLKRLGLQ
jgi:hypothetical protein